MYENNPRQQNQQQAVNNPFGAFIGGAD